jgi:hypothetical protein
MTQISKGETFTDGQQVTGNRLNQLVDASTLLVGAITAQPAIATNGVASTDEMLINDGGVLKKTTVSSLLNSGLAITTSGITTSSVTSSSGGLALNAPSGQIITTNRSLNVTGAISSTGALGVSGLLTTYAGGTMGGTFDFNNAVNFNSTGTVTYAGTNNFTGILQVNGSTVYALKEIYEENIARATAPTANTEATVWFAASSGTGVQKIGGAGSSEIWVIEIDLSLWNQNAGQTVVRLCSETGVTIAAGLRSFFYNAVANEVTNTTLRVVLGAGTTSSWNNLNLRIKSTTANVVISPSATDITSYPDNALYSATSKFRIYKYATA